MKKDVFDNIRLKDFQKIKKGDMIYCAVRDEIHPQKALSDAFYNVDCDEPGWEVETPNGFYSWDSVYVKQKPHPENIEKWRKRFAVCCLKSITREIKDNEFPVNIRIYGDGYIKICDDKDIYGIKIDNKEQLIQFGKDYIE